MSDDIGGRTPRPAGELAGWTTGARMRLLVWLLVLLGSLLRHGASAPTPPIRTPCACNNIPDEHARAACCQRQHTHCRVVPAANGTGFPLGLCVPRRPKPPAHLFFKPCNISDRRQQWDAAPFTSDGVAAPIRNRAYGQCVSTRDERRQPYNPATGPYNTGTVIWAHAPVVLVEASECDKDRSAFTYNAARRTLAVAESGPSTPFGRGSGGCIDVVSTNYSVSASTDIWPCADALHHECDQPMQPCWSYPGQIFCPTDDNPEKQCKDAAAGANSSKPMVPFQEFHYDIQSGIIRSPLLTGLCMSVSSACDPELRNKNGQVVGQFASWWEAFDCSAD